MKQKINIAELLKDCPKGMELDCASYDNVYFDKVSDDKKAYYPILCYITDEKGNRSSISFTKNGCESMRYGAKCVIFPKGKTTWEGFVPFCQFKDGDIVTNIEGTVIIYMEITTCGYCGSFVSLDNYNQFRPHYNAYLTGSLRIATEEEKQKLFDAIKANSYKWNAEKKTLEKLPKFKVGDRIILKDNPHNIPSIRIKAVTKSQYILENEGFLYIDSTDEKYVLEDKFHITTLKPFESRVLVRNDREQYWIPAFWGCKHADGYTTTYGWCKYCIPYEGNEYLLETNNDCDNYYKTWE